MNVRNQVLQHCGHSAPTTFESGIISRDSLQKRCMVDHLHEADGKDHPSASVVGHRPPARRVCQLPGRMVQVPLHRWYKGGVRNTCGRIDQWAVLRQAGGQMVCYAVEGR